MKIACTADIHSFNYGDFSKIFMVKWDDSTKRYIQVDESEIDNLCNPMNSRLFYLLNGLCDMRDYCVENEIHHLLIAGDVFHKRETIEVTVYNPTFKVLESFRGKDIQVYAIAGNHDDVDNSQIPLTSLHPLQNIIEVMETPTKTNLVGEKESIEVVFLPYSKDKQFILDSLKELRGECENPREAVMVCHLGITGGEVGSGQYTMKDEYSLKELMYDKWKYVVAGHYHRPQTLEFNTIYTGSPLQNNFGDEIKGGGYNGFWVIDTNRRWDMRFIPIVAPRFRTVSAEELKTLPHDVLENDYIRVKSSVKNSDEIKDDMESLLKETGMDELNVRLELEKEYNTEQRSDIGIANTFEETVQIYAQERYDGKLDTSKVTEIGLQILSEVTSGGTSV